MEVEYKRVLMMPGYTIEGIIKRENNHDMSKEDVKEFMLLYNAKNDSKIPIVGQSVFIPIKKKMVP